MKLEKSRSLFLLMIALLGGCSSSFFHWEEQPPLTLHSDRRSSATVLVDSSLEMEMNDYLQKNKQNPEQERLFVKSFNRHVLLLGQCSDQKHLEHLAQELKSFDGVKKFYQEASIAPAISSWQKTKDQWITTKITTSMMFGAKTSPWKIHVLTENGVVYLIGIVTPEEEELALEIARQTSGVRKIVKLFDYKSSSKSAQTAL